MTDPTSLPLDYCKLVVGSSWISNTSYPAVKMVDSLLAPLSTVDEHNIYLPMPCSEVNVSSSSKKRNNNNVVIDTKECLVHHSVISAVTAYENQHYGQYKVKVKRHNKEVLWLGCGVDGKTSYYKSSCCFKVKCKYTSPKELKITELNLAHSLAACQSYSRTREVAAKAVGQPKYKKVRHKTQLRLGLGGQEKSSAITASLGRLAKEKSSAITTASKEKSSAIITASLGVSKHSAYTQVL